MDELRTLWATAAAALAAMGVALWQWRAARAGAALAPRLLALEQALVAVLDRQRVEAAAHAEAARAEQAARFTTLGALLADRLEAAAAQAARAEQLGSQRQEAMRQGLDARLEQGAQAQRLQAEATRRALGELSAAHEAKLEQLRGTVQGRLEAMQADNGQRLEQMRATVDEKLHATLERRLGESFALVGERLEMVSRGLGEMQHLASGVGDLRRVLSNIKTRGTWGEVQLGALLEQLLAPEQFAANVAVHPRRSERVDYAVRLPGRDEGAAQIWLPIDAKFPQEDYDRLLVASDRGDQAEATLAADALDRRLRDEAKKIHDKYVCPPHTVDFAIMFLPVEGLFAEALRRVGLFDALLHKYRVVISGPTTLAAMLNSLQMGFRSLAIERRTSDVWAVLGAVKTEFGKFGASLGKLQKKLQEASHSVDEVGTRSRVLERRLRGVEAVEASDAQPAAGLPAAAGAGRTAPAAAQPGAAADPGATDGPAATGSDTDADAAVDADI